MSVSGVGDLLSLSLVHVICLLWVRLTEKREMETEKWKEKICGVENCRFHHDEIGGSRKWRWNILVAGESFKMQSRDNHDGEYGKASEKTDECEMEIAVFVETTME